MKLNSFCCYVLVISLTCVNVWTKIIKREAETQHEISTAGYDGLVQSHTTFTSNSPVIDPSQASLTYAQSPQDYFKPSQQFDYPNTYDGANLGSNQVRGNAYSNQWTTTATQAPYYVTPLYSSQPNIPLQFTEKYNDAGQLFSSNQFPSIDLTQNNWQDSTYLSSENLLNVQSQLLVQSGSDQIYQNFVPPVPNLDNIRTIDLTNTESTRTAQPAPQMQHIEPVHYPTPSLRKPNNHPISQFSFFPEVVSKNNYFKHQHLPNRKPLENSHAPSVALKLLHQYATPHLLKQEIQKNHLPQPSTNKCYRYKRGALISNGRCKPMKQHKDKSKHMYPSNNFLPRYSPEQYSKNHDSQVSGSRYNLGSLHYVPDSIEGSPKEMDGAQLKRPVRFILKRTNHASSICKKLPGILSTLMCGTV